MLRTTRYFALTLLLCISLGSVSIAAQGITPEEMYKRLFTEPVQAEWLDPEILALLPIPQLEAIIAQYKAILGEFVSAEGTAPPVYQLYFERGRTMSQLALTPNGQIILLWFGVPEPEVSGLEEVTTGFEELPGQVSLIVASDRGVLAAINNDVPMAVGSAFKLAILAAIQDQVAAGMLAWDDVVTLEAGDKSLPTGLIQDWPDGTALTIESLAALMISLSDNTATDVLLRVAGREFVELYAPYNRPFLSTREAFALKNPANAELLAAYREGDEAERRALLEELASAPLPNPMLFTGKPVALDIEWYFTVNDLVNLMAYVYELPAMSINPGVASKDDWQYVAYKGGSEPGVLNLTTLVVSDSGATYIVSATWNNPEEALDEALFLSLYSGLLQAIKQLDAQ